MYLTRDLKTAARVLGKICKGELTINSFVQFNCTNDHIEVSGGNLETQFSMCLEGKSSLNDVFYIDISALKGIMNSLGNTFYIEIQEKNILFFGNQGNIVANVPKETFPKEEIICFPEVEKINYFNLTFPEITNIKKNVSPFVEKKDDLRPSLNGVLLDGKNTVGTNAYYLSFPELEKNINQEIIVHPIVFDIAYIMKQDTWITSDKKYILVEGENYTIKSRLIDSIYPRYKNIIPSFTEKVTFEKKDLLPVLKAFVAMKAETIVLDIERDNINLMNRKTKETYTIIKCEKTTPYKIAFDPKLLLTVLNSCGEKVTMQYTESSNKAAIFNDYILLMPKMMV